MAVRPSCSITSRGRSARIPSLRPTSPSRSHRRYSRRPPCPRHRHRPRRPHATCALPPRRRGRWQSRGRVDATGVASDAAPLLGQRVTLAGVPFRHTADARLEQRSELLVDRAPALQRGGGAAPDDAAPATPAMRPFTRAADLRNERNRDALLGAPVHPAWRRHLLRSGVAAAVRAGRLGGHLRRPARRRPRPPSRDAVDIEGTSSPGESRRRSDTRDTCGTARRDAGPPPIRRFGTLAGVFDSQWCRPSASSGACSAIRISTWRCTSTSRARGAALVPNFTGQIPTHLVDAEIRVTAVAGAIFNTRSQLTGIQLLIPALSHVAVAHPA